MPIIIVIANQRGADTPLHLAPLATPPDTTAARSTTTGKLEGRRQQGGGGDTKSSGV